MFKTRRTHPEPDKSAKEDDSFQKFPIHDRSFIPIMVLLPLALFTGVEILHRGGIVEGVRWIAGHPVQSAYNFLIASSLINLLFVFSRKNGFFLLAGFLSLILLALSQMSFIKIDLRGEPLTILDFRLIGEATDIVSVLDPAMFIPFVLSFIIVFVMTLFAFFFFKLRLSRFFAYSAAGIGFAILLFGYLAGVESFLKMRINIPADVSWNHNENGFMLATLVDTKFLKIPEPEKYDKDSIRDIYKRMNSAGETGTTFHRTNGPVSEKPNVIFIMSESFWDVYEKLDLPLNADPIPNIRSVIANTLSGWIGVPGIGGGTANTEYEVLTGLSRRFIKDYSTPYNPYNSYIHRPIRSLATIFSEAGYETTAVHTYHSWFYRRNEVYKYLGFDRFLSLETLLEKPETEGIFVRDRVINEFIIREMERTERRDFIHVVTMQGHGPYKDLNISKDEIHLEKRLSDSAQKTVETYLNLMRGVDESVNALIHQLEHFHEPVMIVFFGDHIPPFGNEVYEQLGFDIYGEWGSKTNMFIWSNFSKLEGTVEMDANLLGAFVLNKLGMKNDPFMNYLYAFYQRYPRVKDGENSAMYEDFRLLQYDIMHGKQYIYDFLGYPKMKERYTVGYPLSIDDAKVYPYQNGFVLDVAGKGISWQSVLHVNGIPFDTETMGGKRAVAVIPESEIRENEPVALSVKVFDSREKVVAQSNELSYGNMKELFRSSESTIGKNWTTIPLNGELQWEPFAVKTDFTIVRAKVGLVGRPFFVIKGEGELLRNENADRFTQGGLADLYENGYVYISVPKEESGWDGKVPVGQIKTYFDNNRYELNVLN